MKGRTKKNCRPSLKGWVRRTRNHAPSHSPAALPVISRQSKDRINKLVKQGLLAEEGHDYFKVVVNGVFCELGKGSIPFKVIHHGILADVFDGHFPSDHLPVLAEVEFRDPERAD